MANSSSMRFDNLEALTNNNIDPDYSLQDDGQGDLFANAIQNVTTADLGPKRQKEIELRRRQKGAEAAARLERFLIKARSDALQKQLSSAQPRMPYEFVGPKLPPTNQGELFTNYNTAQEDAYLRSYGTKTVPPQFRSPNISLGKIPTASIKEKDVEKGTEDGVKKAFKSPEFKAGIIGGIATVIGSTIGTYLTSSAQMSKSVQGSIFGNGYDYGGLYDVNLISAKRTAAMAKAGFVTGGAAAGAAIGGTILPGVGAIPGAIAGAYAGDIAGDIFGSYYTSKSDMHTQALSRAANLRMGILSMSNINPSAAAALGGTYSDMSDNNISSPLNELAQSIAKGVGVYNKNFGQIDKMTHIAAAFSMNMSQANKFGSTVGALSGMKGFNLNSFAAIAKVYGISPDLLGERTLSYIPTAGGNVGTAQDLAAKSFSQSPGYAAHVAGLASTPAIQRFINNQLFTMAGVNYADYMNPHAKGHAKAVAEVNKILSGEQYGQTIPLREALINMEGTTRATADYYDQENQKRKIESGDIKETRQQLYIENLQKNANLNALHNNIDTDAIQTSLNQFNISLGNSSGNINNVNKNLIIMNEEISKLNIKFGNIADGGTITHQSGKTSSGN